MGRMNWRIAVLLVAIVVGAAVLFFLYSREASSPPVTETLVESGDEPLDDELGLDYSPRAAYPRCERELWKGKTPILSVQFHKRASRETQPGPICVDVSPDFVVVEAFCGLKANEPGTRDCFLNSACPYDSSFTNFTDQAVGNQRRLCVTLNRTANYVVRASLVVRGYRP